MPWGHGKKRACPKAPAPKRPRKRRRRKPPQDPPAQPAVDEPETPIGVKRGDSDAKQHIDRILAWQMAQSVEYKKPNGKVNVSAIGKKLGRGRRFVVKALTASSPHSPRVLQLKRRVRKCWKEIDPKVLKNLVFDMPNRIMELKINEGKAIKR